jgi:hypothetical protein
MIRSFITEPAVRVQLDLYEVRDFQNMGYPGIGFPRFGSLRDRLCNTHKYPPKKAKIIP